MEKHPSLESKSMGKNPGPYASRSPPRTGTASSRPPCSGQLYIASPVAAPAPPSENPDHDMNLDMSKSIPSHTSVDSMSKDEDAPIDGGRPKLKSRKRKPGVPVSPKAKAKRGREESSHKNQLEQFSLKKYQKYPVYTTRSEGDPGDCKFWCCIEVDGQLFKSALLHVHKKEAEQDAAKVAYEFLKTRDGDNFLDVVTLIDQGLMLCKMILYEFACKKKTEQPFYSYHPQEGRSHFFSATVSIDGKEYTGGIAKSKKDAAEKAARLAVKSILDTNNDCMLKVFRSKRKLATAIPYSLYNKEGVQNSPCVLSVPSNHSSTMHTNETSGVIKHAHVEESDEVQDNKRSKHEQVGSEYARAGTSYQQPQTYMFQSSTVTYGGSNVACCMASTTRSGGDGVTMEGSREADTATDKATHRIAHGIGNKDHALTRDLDCDGKGYTMQTLQNLNDDELAVFGESGQRNAGQCLPDWDPRVNMLSSEEASQELVKSPATAAVAPAAPSGSTTVSPAAEDKEDSASMENAQPTVEVPIKPKYRHDYYNSTSEVVLTIFAKGVPADSVVVDLGEQMLSVSIELPGEEPYHFQPRLFSKIIPEKSKYIVLSTKVEIRLAKTEQVTWTSLDYKGKLKAPQKINVPAESTQRPSYPSSKSKEDWDKLEAEVKKQEKDEKLDGDATLNKIFQEIYSDADEDMRRAMMKSFVESNGTVGDADGVQPTGKMLETVEGSPGMELKKWEY